MQITSLSSGGIMLFAPLGENVQSHIHALIFASENAVIYIPHNVAASTGWIGIMQKMDGKEEEERKKGRKK